MAWNTVNYSYVAKTVSYDSIMDLYGRSWTTLYLNGVQGVEGSNPSVPTNRLNKRPDQK